MASTVPGPQFPISDPRSPVLGPSNSSNSVLFLDLEATCNEVRGEKIKYSLHEIIEISCISWSIGNEAHDYKIFHKYVKPQVNPVLSDFCTSLTGISQRQVEESDEFPVVVGQFKDWLNSLNIDLRSTKYVCFGFWDVQKALPRNCLFHQLDIPEPFIYLDNLVNFRELFGQKVKNRPTGLPEVLSYFDLKFQGRLHSALDDVKNLHQVFLTCLNLGWDMGV